MLRINFTPLFNKNNNIAYKALQELQKESEESDKGTLLPMIAKNKPELKDNIFFALQKADISVYADNMQSVAYKDIQNSLAEIENDATRKKLENEEDAEKNERSLI